MAKERSQMKADGSGRTRKSERVPLGRFRQKLSLEGSLDPAFYYRWMADEDTRIFDALNAGYTFVDPQKDLPEDINLGERDVGNHTEANGSVVRKPGKGVTRTGEPLFLYLMKLPMELRQEDLAAKKAEIDESERAINEGTLADFENSYVREEHGIKRR